MFAFIRKPFRYTFKNATLAIILINVAVYLTVKILPIAGAYLGLNVINCIGYRMFWQPFTYMFVHGNFQHLLFNMLGLFFFGFSVEQAVGSKEYVLFYLLTGFLCGVSSLFVYLVTGMTQVFLIGASGAIYGILLAYAVIYPKNNIYIFGLIPVRAPILILAYTCIELFSQVYGIKNGVAHSVHLAGFFYAWMYLLIRMGVNPLRVWIDAYR